ncbi:MAG: hypothetical protein R2710_26435, partial [Acidimicrobiales bacterium]
MTALTIIGTGRWPEHLANLLRNRGGIDARPINIRERGWARQLLLGSGPVLRVGLRPGASNRNGRLFDAVWRAAVTLRRRSAAYYWIGTDVFDSVTNGDRVPKWALDSPHWVGAPWFADELEPLGVAAENIWFPTEQPVLERSSSLMPPGPFTVSAYVPAFNADLYGWGFLQKVADALPTIQFKIFGEGSEKLQAGRNVALLGEVANGAAVIEQSHVHLRPTKHDALAGTVREALALSRYVGFSQPFDGVFAIDRSHPEST